MYWTAPEPVAPATLCERCALLALNMAALGFVRRPFGSVAEGLAYINTRAADVDIEPLDLRFSDYGVCGNCGEDKFEPVAL